MKRGAPLKRNKPLRTLAPLRTSREKRTGRRDTGPARSTRELVWERDEGRCAVCGEGVFGRVSSLQHRRARGPGGTRKPEINSPANLLLVCGDGTTGCHGWIEDSPIEAKDAGYAISLLTDEDPADVPVAHAVFGAVYLNHDGTIRFPPTWGDAA